MSLTQRARRLYANRRTGAKWVLAVRWMRRRALWVLDGATPNWRSS